MAPLFPSILSELDGIEPIDRSSMNAFEDSAFRRAVETTGKKRLIIGGLHTEICLTFASVQALKDGYEVMYVADAVGGRSQTAHHSHRAVDARRSSPDHGARRRRSFRDGQRRSPGRPATSSTGTSTRSQGTDQVALQRQTAVAAGPMEMSGAGGQFCVATGAGGSMRRRAS
jgi:hypothetical protein